MEDYIEMNAITEVAATFKIDIVDIIDKIELMPMRQKWNIVAKLINSLNLKTDELDHETKALVFEYLVNRIEDIVKK